MSNLHQWIIVIQIVLNSSGGLSGGDDREHVHIKVHIPEVHRKHTHFRKIQKHHYHPKKVVKSAEYLDADLDTTPFSMSSYGHSDHGHHLQYPHFPLSLPSFPDIPTYGVDNTLEATVIKKPKLTGIPHFVSEGIISKFHGMKKPSEFIGARFAEEMHKFTNPIEDNDEMAYADDYDDRSTEAMILDQRVAGSSHPYAMSIKSQWPPYANVFESSAKPHSSAMKWSAGIPSDWLSSTTEDDYSAYDRFPSPTTMHIRKVKPLSSSRLKFEPHSFETDLYSEPWITPKKKKSKTEKRHRTPSSTFRINY